MEYNQIPLQDFIEMRMGGGIDEIQFKKCLQDYVKKLGEFKNQNEKAIVSNVLAPFLHSLGFIPHSSYKQKGNSEIDLALLKDNQAQVIIEAKKPENSKEFFSEKNPNCKALHECVLYYLRERQNNIKLKFIIITDFFQFFIFSAKEFERYFYRNKAVQDLYKIYLDKGSLIANQQEFYTELEKILNKEFKGDRDGNLFNTTLKGTYFNVRENKDLKYTHQILSREFLHNEFKKDANALNKGFYNELLYILGLKEFNQNGKILIDFDESQETSFAKAIYKKLQESHHQTNYEAKEFTMSHIIIWLNRILFLKLLEASLLKFNDYDEKLKFLTSEKIKNFNDLHHLFFDVLAKDYNQRDKDEGFNFLPYLNSSLFLL